ncbi:MAG: hypothetical protein F4Z34_14615 [Acidimicrobiaceae bacterium]|nr:hypothetical protein [Acidimicrobiaceae bacterium]
MTVALAVVAIIWHQQRTIDKLRDGTSQSIDKLRDGTSQSIDKLRDDTDRGLAKLGAAIAANGERLARIEGFLGIGMPDAAASRAAGATLPKQDPGQAEESGPS